MIRRFKLIDWFVIGALIALALLGGRLYALLAVIILLLYLILRHLSGAFSPKTMNESPEDADTFVMHYDNDDGIVHEKELMADRDINFQPAKSRFQYYGRFDTAIGKADYEYRCEGTRIFFRLLNQSNEGESAGFRTQWEVRDGVVLESDLRARYAAREFKFTDINEELEDLKNATEWQELQTWAFNGFKYFLIKRCLPRDEARRYLRQEVERLKLGNSKAMLAFAEYGFEPDPKNIGGWKQIEGREVRDTTPFWANVESGVYGISKWECGNFATKLVADLQKLLGDTTEMKNEAGR